MHCVWLFNKDTREWEHRHFEDHRDAFNLVLDQNSVYSSLIRANYDPNGLGCLPKPDLEPEFPPRAQHANGAAADLPN